MIRPVPKPTPRKAPLEPGQHRRKYIQQKRTKRAAVDVERRDWCRRQGCIAKEPFGLDGGVWLGASDKCAGPIDPHHAGKNPGIGKKAPEHTLVHICRGHHDQIQGRVGGYGVFQALGRDGRRALQDAWAEDCQARYAAHGGRRGQ